MSSITMKRFLLKRFAKPGIRDASRKQQHHMTTMALKKEDEQQQQQEGNINEQTPTLTDDLKALYNEGWEDSSPHKRLLLLFRNNKALLHGRSVHNHLVRNGFPLNLNVGKALLSMYAKCGLMEEACQVFDEMPIRDFVAWTMMIGGFGQDGQTERAFEFFALMLRERALPNQFTFANAMCAIAGSGRIGLGNQVAAHIVKGGYDKHTIVGGSLVDMYAKCGELDVARGIFDRLPEQSIIASTALLTGYSKHKRILEAGKFFWGMPERNAISWNAIISGHQQNRYDEEAIELFYLMRLSGFTPNQSTYSTVLSACANCAALGKGRHVHALILKDAGRPFDQQTTNALISMYVKCSDVEEALKIFNRMPFRSEVTWNALISGYAQNGQGNEAIGVFERMLSEGPKPSDVTLLCVLTACNHAGLVNHGCHYFHSMCESYGIVPKAEHYACMVDLLGRAGRIHEAEMFIKEMPMPPDGRLWSTLLNCCKIHGHVHLGQVAVQKIIECGAQQSATFGLLSDLLARAGMWEEVRKVKKMRNDLNIKKEPGYSWIEVKNNTHKFLAGDTSHPQINDIYALLKILHRKIADAGYTPDEKTASYLDD